MDREKDRDKDQDKTRDKDRDKDQDNTTILCRETFQRLFTVFLSGLKSDHHMMTSSHDHIFR